MSIKEFWILERVVDDYDWDSSRVWIFGSIDAACDFVKNRMSEWEVEPKYHEKKDDDGYSRILVYDNDVDEHSPWFVIHKGSIGID